MKREVKGFRNNFRKFRTSAKNVPCSIKYPLYWQLLEECLQKDEEAVIFVREQWNMFTTMRIKMLENKIRYKIEQSERSKAV